LSPFYESNGCRVPDKVSADEAQSWEIGGRIPVSIQAASHLSKGLNGGGAAQTLLKSFGDTVSPREYPKDSGLVLQGHVASQVMILESGIVAFRHDSEVGKQSILGIRKAPWIGGLQSVLTQHPSNYTVMTMSRCTIRDIPGSIFRQKLKVNLNLVGAVLELQTLELKEFEFQAIGHAAYSIRQRLEELIWVFSANESDPIRIQLPLTGEQQSQLIGTSLSYLNAQYKELKEKGYVFSQDGWLRVPKRDRLWRRNGRC
jgi:CRP-like cAMP-binding protein